MERSRLTGSVTGWRLKTKRATRNPKATHQTCKGFISLTPSSQIRRKGCWEGISSTLAGGKPKDNGPKVPRDGYGGKRAVANRLEAEKVSSFQVSSFEFRVSNFKL